MKTKNPSPATKRLSLRDSSSSIETPPYLCPIRLDSLTAVQVAELVKGRDIYIWGGAFVGQGIWRGLTRQGFRPVAFLDQSPRFENLTLQGLPVFHPQTILENPEKRNQVFIVTASGHWEHEMCRSLSEAGWREYEDFLSFNDLVPMQPTVDISGICNLYCQGCPRGNMDERPPAGFMSPEVFTLVLDKLLREIPFLGSIQLYIWGEPLLNRHLPAMLRQVAERGLLSIISTNLNIKSDLEEFVKAKPSMVRLSASGYGSSYEFTHTGGDWNLFLANFHKLAELRRKIFPDMCVEVYYHLYQHNQGDDFHKIKALTKEAGFIFRPIWGCLYPWDNLMRLFEGQPLTETARKHQELLIGDLDNILREAQNGLQEPCSQVRCLPINWNLNVLSCGGYYLPRLAENFLETPLADIVRTKMASQLCRTCTGYGIHRVNNPFVADRLNEIDGAGNEV